jgi:hypothetical protein
MKLHYLALLTIALAACNTTPKSAPNEAVPNTNDGLSIGVQAIDGQVMTVASAGNAQLREVPAGVDSGIQIPEFRRSYAAANTLLQGNWLTTSSLRTQSLGASPEDNRVPTKSPGSIGLPSPDGGLRTQSLSALTGPGTTVLSVDGLNFRQQRLANGGNQFSVEPPDQGLCVGNGYVLESVNDVLRIFKTDGSPATGVIDLNTFYGYPAAFDRTKPAGQPRFGPTITDPVCHYDQETGRWFHVVLTIATDPIAGANPGPNSLDIAVSTTRNPTDPWVIYRIPAQNDGTQGTPNHGCSLKPDGTGNGPCLADYPQVSADGEGIYITTNEFSLFGGEFKSANIYAVSKWALAHQASSIRVVNFETVTSTAGVTGYTLQGAIAPNEDSFQDRFGGTQYFLSSNTVNTSTDDKLVTWALTNTRSLDRNTPSLKLINALTQVNPYGDGSGVDQKPGDFPLGQCINDTTLGTPFGTGCWNFLFAAEPAHDEALSKVASNDSRMHKISLVDGKLYGALTTAFSVGGGQKAGIAYFVMKPRLTSAGLTSAVVTQGYLSTLNNNLIFPEVAVNKRGKGVVGFTLVGPDHYPSAAYATISASGVGPVQIAAAGVGPQDGFSGYKAFRNPPRPRWGDYGGAAVDPSTGHIWLASEYINQTCTVAQYTTAPFGSCGGTRATLGNWGTRVTQVKP